MKQKRENMTDKNKNLDDLKAEHGSIASVVLGNATYLFRKPSMGEYTRVSDKMSGKGSNIVALKELVYACSVGEDCTSALNDMPAVIQSIGLSLLEMAGSEIEVTISKV